jgi:tRNA threonylcarbamoyladenosine biosynthesis protein TsaB
MSNSADHASHQPRILILESSSRMGSVAIAEGPRFLHEERFSQSMRHAIDLMPAARRLCRNVGWSPATIDHVYLSTGPGSFTGLRISISIARAMAQAIGCKLVAVSTVDVLAQNAPDHVRNLVVALDAKRRQIFGALYRRSNGMERTAGPALVDPGEFISSAPHPVAVLGEGVDYHRAALQSGVTNSVDYTELDRHLWTPSARAVHALAWQRAAREDFDDPNNVIPVYIRLAEAEEVWNIKNTTPGAAVPPAI